MWRGPENPRTVCLINLCNLAGRKSASNLFEKMRENTPFYTCNLHTGYKTYIHFVKKYLNKFPKSNLPVVCSNFKKLKVLLFHGFFVIISLSLFNCCPDLFHAGVPLACSPTVQISIIIIIIIIIIWIIRAYGSMNKYSYHSSPA